MLRTERRRSLALTMVPLFVIFQNSERLALLCNQVISLEREAQLPLEILKLRVQVVLIFRK